MILFTTLLRFQDLSGLVRNAEWALIMTISEVEAARKITFLSRIPRLHLSLAYLPSVLVNLLGEIQKSSSKFEALN